MSKRIKVLVTMVALVASLGVFESYVHAKANVIDGVPCFLTDGNGGAQLTFDTHAVLTNNKSGSALLVCKAKGDPTSSGKAFKIDSSSGGLCSIGPAGSSDQWHATVSASGRATLVCHL